MMKTRTLVLLLLLIAAVCAAFVSIGLARADTVSATGGGTIAVTSGGTGGVTGTYDGRTTMMFGFRASNNPKDTLCTGTGCHIVPFGGIGQIITVGTLPIFGFGVAVTGMPATRWFPTTSASSTICIGNSLNNACDFTGELTPALPGVADIIGNADSGANLAQAWWAVSSADQTLVAPALNGGAVATHYFGIAVGVGIVSQHFLCCSADGSHASCIDTGVAAGTFKTELDWRTAGHLFCTVNGTTVDKTTDISSSTSVGITPFISVKCNASGTCQGGVSQFIVSAKF